MNFNPHRLSCDDLKEQNVEPGHEGRGRIEAFNSGRLRAIQRQNGQRAEENQECPRTSTGSCERVAVWTKSGLVFATSPPHQTV